MNGHKAGCLGKLVKIVQSTFTNSPVQFSGSKWMDLLIAKIGQRSEIILIPDQRSGKPRRFTAGNLTKSTQAPSF